MLRRTRWTPSADARAACGWRIRAAALTLAITALGEEAGVVGLQRIRAPPASRDVRRLNSVSRFGVECLVEDAVVGVRAGEGSLSPVAQREGPHGRALTFARALAMHAAAREPRSRPRFPASTGGRLARLARSEATAVVVKMRRRRRRRALETSGTNGWWWQPRRWTDGRRSLLPCLALVLCLLLPFGLFLQSLPLLDPSSDELFSSIDPLNLVVFDVTGRGGSTKHGCRIRGTDFLVGVGISRRTGPATAQRWPGRSLSSAFALALDLLVLPARDLSCACRSARRLGCPDPGGSVGA